MSSVTSRKEWLASILLSEYRSGPMAGTSRGKQKICPPTGDKTRIESKSAPHKYSLSSDVYVRLVKPSPDCSEGGLLAAMPKATFCCLKDWCVAVSHFPSKPCTLAEAKALSNGLWRRVKANIPKILQDSLVRKRWSVKVRPTHLDSESDVSGKAPQLRFELTVEYIDDASITSENATALQFPGVQTSFSIFNRVPDEVLIHAMVGFFSPMDVVCLSMSDRRRRVLLTRSSYCLNTILSHSRLNIHSVINRRANRVEVARRSLLVYLLKLRSQPQPNEWSALRGAIAGWMPTSSSISPGMLQMIATLFGLCQIALGRQLPGELGDSQIADGVKTLALVTRDSVQTSRIVRLLSRNHAWMNALQNPPLDIDPAMPHVSLSSHPIDEDTKLHRTLQVLFSVGGPVSRVFQRCANDPQFLCVDSAPLQSLSKLFRSICLCCQHVCDAEGPRIAALRNSDYVDKAESRIVKWYDLGGCTDLQIHPPPVIHNLCDFELLGWPSVDAKLAQSVYRKLHAASREC